MIPLYDKNKSGGIPVVTVGIIIINAIVFIYQYMIGRSGFEHYIYAYGLTPAYLFQLKQIPQQFVSLEPGALKIFTSMFMHGGILHIVMNMWFLWIFGDNVEESMGKIRFFLFYLICGIVAAMSHALFNPGSTVPMVGASGAIAGVMGAYMVLYPHARVVTLFWFLIFIRIIEVPALFYLGFWFLLQLFFSPTGGQVAYLAHVGGFAAGLLLVFLFRKRKRGFRIISVK